MVCCRRESSKYVRCLLKSVGFEVVFAGFLRLLTIVLLFVNLLIFRYKNNLTFPSNICDTIRYDTIPILHKTLTV